MEKETFKQNICISFNDNIKMQINEDNTKIRYQKNGITSKWQKIKTDKKNQKYFLIHDFKIYITNFMYI